MKEDRLAGIGVPDEDQLRAGAEVGDLKVTVNMAVTVGVAVAVPVDVAVGMAVGFVASATPAAAVAGVFMAARLGKLMTFLVG